MFKCWRPYIYKRETGMTPASVWEPYVMLGNKPKLAGYKAGVLNLYNLSGPYNFL